MSNLETTYLINKIDLVIRGKKIKLIKTIIYIKKTIIYIQKHKKIIQVIIFY